jgi:hypothetical protein
MKMVRVEFDSPIDEFAYLIRRLAEFEARFGMSSETFFERFQLGQCDDTAESIEWSNYYQAFVDVRTALEGQLRHAA